MKIEQIEPRHLERIERLFHAALERNSNERGAFLADACAGDESLRVAVLSLLSCDTRAADFIEAPALEVAAQLREEAAARSNTGAMAPDPMAIASGGPSLAESESLSATPIFIGDYRILRKLGEGGMGVVYEAEQQNPRRRVALKVIRGGRLVDEYQVKMFRREAETLARLRHPNIGAIYESGRTEEGQHFFAMELVQGDNLDA